MPHEVRKAEAKRDECGERGDHAPLAGLTFLPCQHFVKARHQFDSNELTSGIIPMNVPSA